ncbi:hypothetical protein V3C99_015658 [Haemonchus contortus]
MDYAKQQPILADVQCPSIVVDRQLDNMDVENAKLVDGLIFGYLGRRQYQETLRAFCNEAPSLRDNRHRFENGGDVYIQVSDQLHEKNLEQIVNAFAVVGRFDVSPELIDFGIRLRDLTNEFSTMTAVKGRTVSKQPPSRASQPSLRDTEQQKSQQFLTTYCASQSANQAAYPTANVHSNQPQQVLSQQDYNYDYQPQPHASTYMMPNSSSYSPMQIVSQTSIASSAQDIPATNTITYLTTGSAMPTAHPPTSCEQPMLIDYGVNVKDNQQDMNTAPCTRNDASEQCGNVPHAHLSSSFSSESGAHKRKAAVPHRRDELVAQTAQSLIVPNGVLLDLDSDAVANSASHASLLSNIDDSAMQCLDRLINGNLNEVFPFCDDHGELSGFDTEMENPYPRNQSRGSVCPEEGSGDPFSEPAPPPLDVGPSHSPPPEAHASKSRSLDEGEIVSEENMHGKAEKTASGNKVLVRSDDFEATPAREHSPTPRSESRRSSLDSGRSKRDDRRTADRLKDFNRNPPKSHSNPRKSTDRSELKDAMIFESGNVPRVHTPTSTGSRLSRERTRGFSSLFEEGHSNPSSRDSSPHREKLSRKEEERRRREKEMEKERQRDKERLKRQRRERHRESDRQPQHSPDRKVEKKARQRDDEEKNRDTKEKEKKREQAEERRVIDEADRRKAEEKARREMVKKKKEEELEARRQAELQRRAEAMKRKEEEERRRRQEEKERQEEKKREEEKRCLEEEKKKKREEDLARREEEKSQKRRDEDDVVQEELRKESEEGRREANSDASDGQETARSTVHSDQESCSSDGDNAPSADNMRSAGRDEEMMPSRKESRGQEQKIRSHKAETRKGSETINRHAERDGPLESEDDVAPPSETDERRKKSREEARPSKSTTDNKKPPPLPIPIRRREEQKRTSVKPLEPGMMMSDPGVLDRINKEMESLTPSSKNRPSSNRSPEESLPSVKSLPTARIPKRDAPVDYNQVLFSNPPVVKRTPPVVEKKKNYVISSGLSTPNVNQMVFSKAHSSRLGMFLEKVSDKHKRLMERENDRATASPAYDDPDRDGAPSPIGFSHFPRQQQQKFAPQKRPLPATSLDSYLGSPPQGSPDIRDGESTSSRSTGKKCKLDLSKMPDIIDKLYGGK